MSPRTCHVVAITAVLVAAAKPAWADVGTPLIWGTAMHLFLGNLGIGVLEGSALEAWCGSKASYGARIGIMALANYLSAWLGVLALQPLITPPIQSLFGDLPLNHMGALLVTLVLISLALTILIEWPFCYWALGRAARTWRGALRASARVNCLSYAVLALFYGLVSDTGMLRNTHTDPSLSFARGVPAWVLYLGKDGKAVYSSRLDGSGRRQVAVLERHLDPEGASLRVLPQHGASTPEDRQRASLLRYQSVADALSGTAHLPVWASGELRGPGKRRPTLFPNWGTLTLEGDGQGMPLGMQTPVLLWHPNWISYAPGDFAVMELSNQIVVLDLKTRIIGALDVGTTPLVVLDSVKIPPAKPIAATRRRW